MSKHINFKKHIISVIAAITLLLLLMAVQSVTAHAAPQHGFGTGQGRIDTVNLNDHHTAAWDRFSHNYQFTSGPDHRFELGRPTTFSGFVPVDVFTVNIRRDANVSLRPPNYGTFNGNFHSDPTSRFFPQPVNPNFHQPFTIDSTTIDPRLDTLQQGVNHRPAGNPMDIHNVGSGEFLPPTSINDRG